MTGLLIVAATVFSYALGWAIGIPVLVPILNTLASYPFMVLALKRGDLRLAVGRMLIWALAMGATATLLSYARPAQTGLLFLRAQEYRTEMFNWVLTGVGPESTPSQFIPHQIGHAGLFAGAALASGGALAMPMGAVLMNSMGDYVGSMAHVSAHPAASIVLGWHPWAVIRIIGFVIIGVVLSGPVLARVWRFPFSLRAQWGWLRIGAGLLVLDIALKWLLAPTWGRLLKGIAGW
jgi:hypothetical protein